MKQINSHGIISSFTKIIIAVLLLISVFALNSFITHRVGEEFLKQLGISKSSANEKIYNSIIGGYFDSYGVKNAKNILAGNRGKVANDLLVYTKLYVNSEAFKKEYEAMRQTRKPKAEIIKTVEDIKKENISTFKKMVAETETNLKTASKEMKPIFENVLVEGRKALADAESPDNKFYSSYSQSYPQMVKDADARYQGQLNEWEEKYPANQLQFVKKRLEEFLTITSDIDFTAALITKYNKQVFVNAGYERKDARWKMAYRAGKEVVDPARQFARQWIEEIK
jgi:hypothetical protein